MDKLYTFIMDYNGGTYISQNVGTQLHTAFNQWIKNFDFSKIKIENGDQQIEDIDTDILPIDGLENVWCTTFYIATKLALVHIVKTVVN